MYWACSWRPAASWCRGSPRPQPSSTAATPGAGTPEHSSMCMNCELKHVCTFMCYTWYTQPSGFPETPKAEHFQKKIRQDSSPEARHTGFQTMQIKHCVSMLEFHYHYWYPCTHTHLRSFGVRDCAASRSNTYWRGTCNGCFSLASVAAHVTSSSLGSPASHITCWFLSVRSKDLTSSQAKNCSSNANWNYKNQPLISVSVD